MRILSENEIIGKIEAEEIFTATVAECGLLVKIEQYVPGICTAIHNGHHLRESLRDQCSLSDAERLYEEDPFTGEFIQSNPISLIAQDSRYEYDLNRSSEHCIYETAWSKSVWKKPLSAAEISLSREKHRSYYRILYALVKQLEKKFNACVLYDFHAYNYKRIDEPDTPTLNIGTAQINNSIWKNEVNHYFNQLKKISLPNLHVRVAKNEVFRGLGYQATFINENFRHTLILATEIKKVFMDENTGEVFPLVLAELKEGLKYALAMNAAYFARKRTSSKYLRKTDLLASKLDKLVRNIDQQLYQLGKGIETLLYINPINLQHEKKTFFSRKFNYQPNFRYRQLTIDPYLFKERLYRVPVDSIQDISIQTLYRKVVDAYAGKIDMITAIGSDKFLYNSLRYYGEPDLTDIHNARFLLYARDLDGEQEITYNAEQAKLAFEEAVRSYDIKCRVEISSKILAAAMVNNIRKSILINKHKILSSVELNALIHHELGVHMVTTVNSELQPLKVFRLGLPGNTHTQEGLAILSEYLSGNLTYERLQVLALRVIAVDMLIKKYDFSDTFRTLLDNYQLDREKAFNITARVYRGGGFTKDFLYLRGLRDAYHLYQNQGLDGLFIGKTSFEYLDLINELITRKILHPPKYLPRSFSDVKADNMIMNYIISSIR